MKLLVTGAWRATEEQLAPLRKDGYELHFQAQERDVLVIPPQEVEGVICNGLFLYHPLEAFRSLRLIQLTSAGLDRVPLEAIRARGITLFNARGVYSGPMAEHALAGVLSLYRHMGEFNRLQTEGNWGPIRSLEELAGKRVVIVGCGSVGRECARRFTAMGCQVIGVDSCNIVPADDFAALHPVGDLDTLLPNADILLLTLPLTDETRHLFDGRLLSRLKNRAVLVNLARGAVVEPQALQAELVSGRLRAVLDVFEEEPLDPASPLWHLPDVIITPHVAYAGNGNSQRLFRLITTNLHKFAIMDGMAAQHIGN